MLDIIVSILVIVTFVVSAAVLIYFYYFRKPEGEEEEAEGEGLVEIGGRLMRRLDEPESPDSVEVRDMRSVSNRTWVLGFVILFMAFTNIVLILGMTMTEELDVIRNYSYIIAGTSIVIIIVIQAILLMLASSLEKLERKLG